MTQSFTMLGTVVEYVRVYPDPVLESVVAFKLKDSNGNILHIRTRYQSHALQHVVKIDDEVYVVGELRRYKDPDGGPPHLVIWATHVFIAPRHVLAKTAAAVQAFPPHPGGREASATGEGGQGGEAAVAFPAPVSPHCP